MSDPTTPAEALPELGTAEAAVRSCVNLISRATGQPEQLLAYWLDLYFQVRLKLEQPHPEALIAPSQPPSYLRKAMEDASTAIKDAAAEAFQAAESAARKEPPAPPKKSPQGEAAEFKRETYTRLLDARSAGVPVPRIVAMAENNITEDEVRSILAAKQTPIAVYRVLAGALDRLQAEEGKA